MRSGVTHYPMSCHGCFVGCGEMTPSRLQPMTRQTLHISRLWRDMILARLRPYRWAAPATKIIRMALWRRRPGSIQVAPHVQAGGVGATWAPCARMAGKWLETEHIRPIGGRHSSVIFSSVVICTGGHASCRPLMSCRYHAGAPAIWCVRCAAADWWPRSAAVRCGVGCTRMRFVLGTTAVGSFREIPTSPRKPVACWICMPASGRANR